ncbi:uncharacterized protein [Drosophila bipectinata]|uniref:uncharacterized protein n=1 Tax=Drosophila bipectinata TaxID=42026 RepID=UPI001C8933DC|nr:uncharacterized protein LOC122321622 [Drosophila bipectinata]
MISSSFVRLGLLLFILSLATSQDNCMKNGGFCQAHGECCSKKCLTFMQQCAKRVGSSEPFPPKMG